MSQTKLQSSQVELHQSSERIYDFLCNLNNFQKLMPPEISDWNSTETECSFTLKGMPTIGFILFEKTPVSTIVYKATGKVPSDIYLRVALESAADNACKAQLFLEAELNPMLKMMVEKPLTKLLEVLAANLSKLNPEA